MKRDILIIDDNPDFKEKIGPFLRQKGYDCEFADDGETGLRKLESSNPFVVLCDVIMPGTDGLDILDQLVDTQDTPKVIMISRSNSMDSAILSFRKGADDYMRKPIKKEHLLKKLEQLDSERQMRSEVRTLRKEVEGNLFPSNLVHRSSVMQELAEKIKKIAPTRSNVFIEGETGAGKELIARAIHNRCFPAGRKFIPVNCGALSDQLFESELFGHVKGAFTGAENDKVGYFEAASDGTLFLDEISEISNDLQVKLLRAIENNEISRVGSVETREVHPRIIAATNRNSETLVEEGKIREDLFYRLNVLRIEVPPLRERKEDIPLLVEHFLEKFSEEFSKDVQDVSDEAMDNLIHYSWPGNVRELKNVIERAVILAENGIVTLDELSFGSDTNTREASGKPEDLREAVKIFKKQHIQSILEKVDGDRSEASERLGIDPSTLYRKLKE